MLSAVIAALLNRIGPHSTWEICFALSALASIARKECTSPRYAYIVLLRVCIVGKEIASPRCVYPVMLLCIECSGISVVRKPYTPARWICTCALSQSMVCSCFAGLVHIFAAFWLITARLLHSMYPDKLQHHMLAVRSGLPRAVRLIHANCSTTCWLSALAC